MYKSKNETPHTICATIGVKVDNLYSFLRLKKNIIKAFQDICRAEGREAHIDMTYIRPMVNMIDTKEDTIEIIYRGESLNPPKEMIEVPEIDFDKPISDAAVKKAGKFDRLKEAVIELNEAAKEIGIADRELNGLLFALTKIIDALGTMEDTK